LVALELQKFEVDVEELVEGAQKEDKIENKLKDIVKAWDKMKFDFEVHKDVPILAETTEIVELVEQHGMDIQGMLASKDVAEFKETVEKWRNNMKTLDSVIDKWKKVQSDWKILRPIFIESDDIRAQLPESTVIFQKVNEEWRELMIEASEEPGVIAAATAEGRLEKLKTFEAEIETCNKALSDQLESKRKLFPRFYFVSQEILLTILSNSGNPEKVNEYMGDCFDGMGFVVFDETVVERPWRTVRGMKAKDGEIVPWGTKLTLNGAVEAYMTQVEAGMQMELVQVLEAAKSTTEQWRLELPREIWLESYNAQISLLATQIVWTEETLAAFEELESGAESAMKENLELIRKRISKLIERVRDVSLIMEVRIKIITIITVDVHARDICDECVVKKIMDSTNFLWARQLKFGMEKHPGFALDPKMEHMHCIVNICDWMTWYSYEYVGNCGRLVITPLTDRCYITLTQALNLQMGAAPAGPAGTGKTETTKDLGRALGLRVVVYNCSDQMTYKTLAQIFMGLSQSGFWGCFDEFNRISIEVLSVVSSQVKNVLDALIAFKQSAGVKNTFIFMNAETAEEISLKNTVGFFITMNPGYAGRTELPENLKAQFRYCAMVVPDMVLICENMLMSEGFETAKELAKKFMTLYDLCKSLLSGMVHYDWGLRAVKSLLRSAGGLKRADLTSSEDLLLMKALRDFNIAKIVEADISIFMGLIKTLFPGMEADAVQNLQLREACCEVAVKANLQTDAGFILKCEQMFDILQVRHSIFLIGASGLGKSATWKNLAQALSHPIMNGHMGQNWNTIVQQVDPKAVSSDELCGWENLKTKEWRDGVLSSMFRNMVKNWGKYTDQQQYKWVVMDGDVDPEWIESLNTVMDDNKVLTLVSNERIPLTPEMRLIIEVANLRNATPATVSRGGVLFINNGDIGW
jgi:dynein heavy chain